MSQSHQKETKMKVAGVAEKEELQTKSKEETAKADRTAGQGTENKKSKKF